jgi:hypothetical protein
VHLLSLGTSAWRRLISRPVPVERTVKVRELTWRSVEASVWPVGWVDRANAGAASDVPESGVLEGFTRLGNRLLLRINVKGRSRIAGLEWDPPPSVHDVEAVLHANLGAQMEAIGQLDVPIRIRPRPSA